MNKREVQKMHNEAQAPIDGDRIGKMEVEIPGVDKLPVQPASTALAMISVIERAALNPEVDVEKMERLLAMQERIMAREAKASFTRAMLEMRPKLPIIDKRGRIEIREKDGAGKRTGALQQKTPYALWEDIDEAITPILMEHGFDLSHRTGVAPDGKVTITAVLDHRDGHSETNTVTLPHDPSGSKNPVQGTGSSYKYGTRYSTVMLLRLRIKNDPDDDDGKAAGIQTVSEDQLAELRKIADNNGVDVIAFCQWAQIPSLAEMPADFFDRAKTAMMAKKKTLKPGPYKEGS